MFFLNMNVKRNLGLAWLASKTHACSRALMAYLPILQSSNNQNKVREQETVFLKIVFFLYLP